MLAQDMLLKCCSVVEHPVYKISGAWQCTSDNRG